MIAGCAILQVQKMLLGYNKMLLNCEYSVTACRRTVKYIHIKETKKEVQK